ncbi:PucR family transcriptional regulator [Bacillus massiliigorillae]|uniref:PucR family transcriptional regulator n=1 Tax=Bacillus massiliigorillae TaxID=1243664 RepID=UPI0003A40359|nr:helix-turn-helix domain-containing protein [Bacillus massiliigorillae]
MLLQKLKKQYPSAVESAPQNLTHQYFWVSTDGKQLGIPLENLTSQEQKLLTTLFNDSALENTLNITASQKNWYQFFTKQSELPLTNWKYIRLIYFTIADGDVSLVDFEQAILSFFHSDSVLVWENKTSGYIIEGKHRNLLEFHDFPKVISTIESDFYNTVQIFVGNIHEVSYSLLTHFSAENQCFAIAKQHCSHTKHHCLKTVFPYLLLNGIIQQKDWYLQQLLGETIDDQEIIKTVKTYIQLNRNATLTAKELFIHRNSLQYRIDKFIEKTNLDIKDFHDATLAYLCILLL